MSARVIGGTYNGDTEVDVTCPRLTDKGGSPRFLPCGAEVTVFLTDKGSMTCPAVCPDPVCGAQWTGSEIGQMQEEAMDALDNYDPSESQLAALYDLPTVSERQSAEWRMKEARGL